MTLRMIQGGKLKSTTNKQPAVSSTAALIGRLKLWMQGRLPTLTGESRQNMSAGEIFRAFISLAALILLSVIGLTLLAVIMVGLTSCVHQQHKVRSDYRVVPKSISQPNPPELASYHTVFLTEAYLRGVRISKLPPIKLYFADIRDLNPNDSKQVAGLCRSDDEAIIIDRTYWKHSSLELREVIIMHELGHCQLDRRHDEACERVNHNCVRKLSIMTAYVTPKLLPYTKHRKEYLDELFRYTTK